MLEFVAQYIETIEKNMCPNFEPGAFSRKGSSSKRNDIRL